MRERKGVYPEGWGNRVRETTWIYYVRKNIVSIKDKKIKKVEDKWKLLTYG